MYFRLFSDLVQRFQCLQWRYILKRMKGANQIITAQRASRVAD